MTIKPKAIHCVYFKVGNKGNYRWGARLSYPTKSNATGTFTTIANVKTWAQQWARSIGAKVTFERVG